jgi:hypothetical protein
LHLWQIRQFPGKRDDPHGTHLLCTTLIFLIFSSRVIAQPQAEPDPSNTAASEIDAAQDYFEQAVAKMGARKSVEANLREQVQIGDQPIRMTGRYLERGSKSRLELQIRLAGGRHGSLLEVCDGDLLWNQTDFDESTQVTLRDIKQIATAVADEPSFADSGHHLELGLGGLAGLMRSLQRTMQFDHLRKEGDGDATFVVIQGKWKSDYAAQWKKGPEDDLPAYVPDLLRIYFDAESQFPRRFLYLKRLPDKETYRPIVRLDFQDVQFDQELDDSVFEYTPPEGLVPDDITQQYIEQLKRRNSAPKDAPQGGQTPPGK